MERFNFLSITTRRIIYATVIFLIYGYLCRLVGVYFFWESRTIGWTLFWIAAIFVLRDRIKEKKDQKKSTLLEKIGIGFSVFALIIKGGLFFAIRQTSAYESAMTFIRTNSDVQNKVGDIKSISLIPLGGIAMTSNSQGSAGEADLHFVVKGTKRYLDLNLVLYKDFDTDWKIEVNE